MRIPTEYYQTIVGMRLFSDEKRLRHKVRTLFGMLDFEGKRVIDIGGGRGVYSFYAHSAGAREVICLEPESAGSTSGVRKTFDEVRRKLAADAVQLIPTSLQEYDVEGQLFDVVFLHNSINHLDEQACMRLKFDAGARATYRQILTKLYDIAKPGSTIVLCDCSSRNLFADLGFKNPFMPRITWEKHQTPKLWAQLLTEVGFRNPRIRWSSFNRFGGIGRALLGNSVAAYLTSSHFVLTMDKP